MEGTPLNTEAELAERFNTNMNAKLFKMITGKTRTCFQPRLMCHDTLLLAGQNTIPKSSRLAQTADHTTKQQRFNYQSISKNYMLE